MRASRGIFNGKYSEEPPNKSPLKIMKYPENDRRLSTNAAV
jgi:hypothetical protein